MFLSVPCYTANKGFASFWGGKGGPGGEGASGGAGIGTNGGIGGNRGSGGEGGNFASINPKTGSYLLLRGKECPDSNKANVKNENLGKDGGKGGNAPEVTAKMGTLFITGNVTVTAKGGQGGAAGARGEDRAAKQRTVYPVAGRDGLHRRADTGGMTALRSGTSRRREAGREEGQRAPRSKERVKICERN